MKDYLPDSLGKASKHSSLFFGPGPTVADGMFGDTPSSDDDDDDDTFFLFGREGA